MNILLGVTGSISAYKSLDIISGFRASGHDVKVMQSDASMMFVTEMSLATISGHQVFRSFDPELSGTVHHIALAKWADVLIIAPATANTIAKLSMGIADNFLLSAVLAFDGVYKFIAPAMNVHMYSNAVTGNNIKTLQSNGWDSISPVSGILACGDVGQGKLERPRRIVEYINRLLLDMESS